MFRRDSADPINRKGSRTLDCPFYGDCLMHAAELNCKAWPCERCPNRMLDSVRQELKFIAPYYQIMAEINAEFKRKYAPLMNGRHYQVLEWLNKECHVKGTKDT